MLQKVGMIMKYIQIFFIGLIFISCLQKSIISPKDSNNFYGLGQEDSIEIAKLNAFNALALSIKSNIRYPLNATISSSNNSMDSNIQNSHVTTNLKELKNVEVVDITRAKSYFVLVKLSEENLSMQLKNDIQNDTQQILQGCDFPALNKLKQVQNSAKELNENILLLNSVDSVSSINDKYSYLYSSSPALKVNFNTTIALQNVTAVELSKFIKITDDANLSLKINIVKNEDNYNIYFHFYNCQGKNNLNLKVTSDSLDLNSLRVQKLDRG